MKIRRAEYSEAAPISGFVSELAVIHIAPTLLDGGIETLLDSIDPAHTAQRMHEGYPYWIAEEGNEIVGVAAVRPPSHLYHLFVATDRQRRGIGRLLLDKAIHFISEAHDSPRATVNASLNSIDAYRTYGFTVASDVQTKGGVRYQPMSIGTTPLVNQQGA